ncbi:hypothetical protein EUX98_g3566 [Antrodiella citrinella]|uniref:Homeobox domain-containing protein n=1 Tax=Antrodiella citrinella TaxID=2447956 RepID=A0A4S4MWA7_9APHY|nr:hypothetical protein EUX98_g3566 [Antrodiella citrinella]
MPPAPLSRTSSAYSVASDETVLSMDDNTVVPNTPSTGHASDGGNSMKRTRKRFTNAQIIALEQVFHQTSHPTREQREAVAVETGLELRSVTIWFQNKRQTERKIALCYGPNFVVQPAATTRAAPLATNASYQRSIRHSIHAHRPQVTTQCKPSLDSVASRHERPQVLPKTPTRVRTYSSPDPNYAGTSMGALWENMPSSPVSPITPERERGRDIELVDFGKKGQGRTKRTLEWACAAARVSGRQDEPEDDARTPVANASTKGHVGFMVDVRRPEMEGLDFGGDTEDESEAHEAITPSSSQSRMNVDPGAPQKKAVGSGRKLRSSRDVQNTKAKGAIQVMVRSGTHDEEMVNAALVLCGLGKR